VIGVGVGVGGIGGGVGVPQVNVTEVEVDDIVVADGVISVNVAPASLVNGVGKLITPAEVNFIVDV
jgi:hypothetical protein